MIYIIIYLIGYILAYYSFRHMDRKDMGKYYDWEAVKINLFFSLFSWVFLIGFYFSNIKNFLINHFPTKPPKWL